MGAHWRTISAIVITAATVGVLVMLQQLGMTVPNPAPIYFCAVVFAAYAGGWTAGIVSALITLVYALVFFSKPGQLFAYTPDNLSRLTVLFVTTTMITALTALLKHRAVRALAREKDAHEAISQQNADLMVLRAALDKSKDGIIILDKELRAEFINRAFREIWKLPDEIADSNPAFVGLMYHGRDTKAYEVADYELDSYISERVAQIRSTNEMMRDLRLSDGRVYRLKSTPVSGDRRLLTYTNVTDIVQHSDELEALRSALDHVENGIMLLDADLRIMFTNRAFRNLSKLPEDYLGRKPTFGDMLKHYYGTGVWNVPLESWEAYCAERIAAIKRGDPTPRDLRRADGRIIRLHCFTLPDGGRMLTYYDVTDVVHHTDALERLATVDGLTGIANRRHFSERAEAEWSRHKRYSRPLSVLMIDIDHFKTINDDFGHAVGDQALIHVAAICGEGNRTTDVIARLGGEEFGLLLPETSMEHAFLVAERLRLKIESAPLKTDGHSIPITASVGVATANGHTASFQDLMKAADDALYDAKHGGRNRVSTAKPDDSKGSQAIA